MKKTIAIVLAVAVSALLAGCGTSQATDASLADVKAKGYFIMGVDDSFAPMSYFDESTGEFAGFNIDLARACAEKMGLTGGAGGIKVQPVAWDYMAEELNGRKVDVIWNGCTITAARKEKFVFTKPYLSGEQVVVVLSGSDILTLNGLKGKRMGFLSGSTALDAYADMTAALGELVAYANVAGAMADLESKRLDAVAVSAVVFTEYNVKHPGVFERLQEALGTEEFGAGLRKSDKTFKDELQKALDTCMSDGTVQAIAEKWLKREYPQK